MPVTAVEVNEAASRADVPNKASLARRHSRRLLRSSAWGAYTYARAFLIRAEVSRFNAAAIGPAVDDPRAAAGAAGYRKWRPENLSQKIQESSKSVLTHRGSSDYIRPTNEGGAPLATKKFASRFALVRNSREPRERHSDWPEAEKRCGPRHCVKRCLFFDN